MKHFFPFLAILLLLCLLPYTFPILPVSAQQHNSFASARYLSLDRSTSIALPANAYEYYYFLSLHTTDSVSQQYQIILSQSESLSVSVYDDQGSPVSLQKTSNGTSNWTGYINNLSDSERFFLVLHNQAKQDIHLQLSVKPFSSPATTILPKSGSNGKKMATASPGKKVNSSSSSKATVTQKPRSTSKQTSPLKSTAAPKPQTTPKRTYRSKSTVTQKPRSTPKQTSPSLSAATPKTHKTTISRSDSVLTKHFFRMSTGYSFSAFELLSIHLSETELLLENLTPETISLQNNIIFAKSPGLAVIRIHHNDYTTSCTIYVQSPQ